MPGVKGEYSFAQSEGRSGRLTTFSLRLKTRVVQGYAQTHMEIQFRYTESDYVAVQYAWILHRPWKIIRGYWYSLLILCMVTVGVIVNPQRWQVGLAYGLVAVAVAIPGLLTMRWRWHRQFKQSDLADVDVTATVDEKGVMFSARGNQKTHMWAGFSQIYESNRTVVLEKDEGDFLFLCKRAMSSTQLAELERLAAASTSNCKVTLTTPLA